MIPDSLTANTGFIGLRAPNHPIAIQLIEKAKVPIAAPSANLFSHVSPTLAQHVIDDFFDSLFDIKVIDGKKCSFGIESTVAKICKENEEVVVKVFRRGGISEETLRKALNNRAHVYHLANFSGIETSNEAPGQLIKHYSPNVETYLLETGDTGDEICEASKAVLIDFNSKNFYEFKAVIHLSECGNVDEAINNLYESLRIAEVQGGDCIVIGLNDMTGDHSLALWDRVFRATSGRKVVLKNDKIYYKS